MYRGSGQAGQAVSVGPSVSTSLIENILVYSNDVVLKDNVHGKVSKFLFLVLKQWILYSRNEVYT